MEVEFTTWKWILKHGSGVYNIEVEFITWKWSSLHGSGVYNMVVGFKMSITLFLFGFNVNKCI